MLAHINSQGGLWVGSSRSRRIQPLGGLRSVRMNLKFEVERSADSGKRSAIVDTRPLRSNGTTQSGPADHALPLTQGDQAMNDPFAALSNNRRPRSIAASSDVPKPKTSPARVAVPA